MTNVILLPIVGAAVSALVQLIKSSVGTSRSWTILVVFGLSLVAGGIYYAFRGTMFWSDAIQILLYANAIYGFVIAYFEPSVPTM